MSHETPHFGTAEHGEQVCTCLCAECYDHSAVPPEKICRCAQCDCHDIEDPSVDLHYEVSA